MIFTEEIKTKSVSDYYDIIIKLLQNFKEKCIPQFKKSFANNVPWLNSKLKLLIKRKVISSKGIKNGQSYSKIKCISVRNLVTKQIKLAKQKYESQIIRRSRNNRMVFYTYFASKNCSKKIGL